MLHTKIAASLKKIIPNSNFKKRVKLAEQKAQLDGRFFCGRQIACMIYEYFWVTGTHEAILEYSDPFNVTLRGDEVHQFDTRWDEVLLSIRKVPPVDILESLKKTRAVLDCVYSAFVWTWRRIIYH